MNNEEKLKAAKRLYQTANSDQKYVLESLFPELKESEDEKIIKELITHCRNTRCVTEEGAERIAKWIAWLEKQSENEKGERKKDDAYSEFAISAVEDYYGGDNPLRKEIVDWLKSLKQRIKGE